jgi:hypothetical protein
MKNTIKCIGIAVIAVIALTVVFASCDNGTTPEHTHTWGAWQETKAPTETAEGEETRTCAACGEKETRPIQKLPEQPQFRSEEKTFEFGGKATIQGTLLQAEWDNVIDQLPQIINGRYAAATEKGPVQVRYDNVFNQTGTTITVEKTQDYANWKTGADGKTLSLNFNTFDNWSSIINSAVKAMDEFTATQG